MPSDIIPVSLLKVYMGFCGSRAGKSEAVTLASGNKTKKDALITLNVRNE